MQVSINGVLLDRMQVIWEFRVTRKWALLPPIRPEQLLGVRSMHECPVLWSGQAHNLLIIDELC